MKQNYSLFHFFCTVIFYVLIVSFLRMLSRFNMLMVSVLRDSKINMTKKSKKSVIKFFFKIFNHQKNGSRMYWKLIFVQSCEIKNRKCCYIMFENLGKKNYIKVRKENAVVRGISQESLK